MLKIPNQISRSLALWACCLLGSILPAAAQITWNFTTDTPSSGVPTNLTVGAVTQGNNNGTTVMLSSTSPSTTPTFSGGNNAAAAARTGPLVTDAGGSAYFEVTLTPDAGFAVNFTGIAFGSRSTGTGPTAYTVRTSFDGYGADVATATGIVTGSWAARSSTGFLVSSAAPLTLRLYGHSGVGSPGASTANFRIDDLVLTVDVITAGGTPPTVTSFSPAGGFPGDTVTINGSVFGASPTVRFNGTVATGTTVNGAGTQITTTVPAGATTGLIQVSTSGGSAPSATPFTVLALPALELLTDATFVVENGTLTGTVRRPADAPFLNLPLTVNLNSANPAKATITSSVIIPANDLFTGFTITGVPDNVFGPTVNVIFTASATGFNNGTASVAVTNVDTAPVINPTVVINKMLNGTPELVELLVVGNGTSGTTLDMQGMMIKDYSNNLLDDNGGKRLFATTSLWAAVPVGTLIVISTESNTSTDLDASDFLLRVGLRDTTLFTGTSGTFNMAGTEMVMIKASGSTETGEAGSIHAVAYGALATPTTDPNTAFARYGNTTSFKNFANGTNSAIVQNPNATLADFNGGPATTATLATADFGKANNPSNNGFIRSLRGITSLSGVGTASIVNDTAASPFLGRNIFDRGLSGQRAAISLLSDVNPGTLTRASIVVPATLGVPLPANVSVTGAGAGIPVVSITGQTITLSGLAVTTVNPAIVTIGGLTTPSPTGIMADGRYEFAVSTAGPSGSLASIAVSASAVVIIPIESLKDVDSITGVPPDLNKVVAISGVVTEENFNNAQLSGFIQDGDFGMNIFSFNTAIATLVRGNRYVITGTVVQFAGLTEVVPAVSTDVIDLGPGTPPVPLVVTPLEISAPLDAQALENLEGRLIKVRGLSYVSGTWADPTPPATPTSNNINDVILKDAGGNNITIRIAAATTANAPPAMYPASITGILSQAVPATSTNLFTGYILMPRDPADLEVDPIVSGYTTWASAYPGIGTPENDADGDGQSNYLEYTLGTIPDNRTSVQPMVVNMSGGKPALSITKGMAASADPTVFYQIQGTPDLISWATTTSPETPLEEVTNTAETLTVRYLGTSAKYYFRLKVGPPPP